MNEETKKEAKDMELNLEDMENVSGGASRPSGMPCPQCGGFIPFSMQQIIEQQFIVCPHCGLRLNINQ